MRLLIALFSALFITSPVLAATPVLPENIGSPQSIYGPFVQMDPQRLESEQRTFASHFDPTESHPYGPVTVEIGHSFEHAVRSDRVIQVIPGDVRNFGLKFKGFLIGDNDGHLGLGVTAAVP